MREIKFRGWEKHTKRMAEVTTFKWQPDHLYHQVYTRAIVNEKMIGEWYAYDFGGDSNGIILMQYTGLKDKNGVEIYEGDIVNAQYFEKLRECEWLEVEQIVFMDGAFMLKAKFDDIEFYRPLMKMFQGIELISLEVIGNIYESKELLEEGENT